jgi:hypothetical protein
MSVSGNISIQRLFGWATVSALVNTVIFYTASVLGASWNVGSPQPVNIVLVLGFTLVPIVLGAWVTSLVAKKSEAARKVLVWAGFALAILSTPGGLVLAADQATGIALAVMHPVVAVAWLAITLPRK